MAFDIWGFCGLEEGCGEWLLCSAVGGGRKGVCSDLCCRGGGIVWWMRGGGGGGKGGSYGVVFEEGGGEVQLRKADE